MKKILIVFASSKNKRQRFNLHLPSLLNSVPKPGIIGPEHSTVSCEFYDIRGSENKQRSLCTNNFRDAIHPLCNNLSRKLNVHRWRKGKYGKGFAKNRRPLTRSQSINALLLIAIPKIGLRRVHW